MRLFDLGSSRVEEHRRLGQHGQIGAGRGSVADQIEAGAGVLGDVESGGELADRDGDAHRYPPSKWRGSDRRPVCSIGPPSPPGLAHCVSGRYTTGMPAAVGRVRTVMTTIGLIGAGNIGGTVARLAIAAGYDVVLSNSRGPETLTDLIEELGTRARAATSEEAAAQGDLVVVTIPLKAYRDIPIEPLAGKVVIDTDNYLPRS